MKSIKPNIAERYIIRNHTSSSVEISELSRIVEFIESFDNNCKVCNFNSNKIKIPLESKGLIHVNVEDKTIDIEGE